MFKQTLQKRELLVRGPRILGLVTFCVAMILAIVFSIVTPAAKADAATNDNLNFQARLQTASGAIVSDGYYNIEFKLYDVSSSGSSLWSEAYYDANGATAGSDNRVRVKNGYLSVNLGSQADFPTTINWDEDLWLTMNIGGTTQTATPTYDGEMNPRLKLTGVPYAFKAGELAKRNAATGYSGVLQFQPTTGGNQIFIIPDQGAAGTYTLLTSAAAAENSIQNATSPQQDANFNISGIGKAGELQASKFDSSDASTLSLGTDNASAVNIGSVGTTTTVYGDLVVTGSTTGQTGATFSGATISLNDSSNYNTSINTGSSNGQVNIGGGSGTFSLNTSNIDISNSGAISGATGLTLSSGSIDQSASSGTLKSGTGAVSLNGDTTIAGGKSLTANGTALFQGSTNSISAFQVQNVAGASVMGIDTTPESINLITNSSFEADAAGWTARGATSNLQRTTGQHYSGNAALSFGVAGVGQGVNYPIQLSPNTSYTFSAFIKVSGSSGASVRIGYAADGSTEATYQSGNMAYSPSGWSQMYYTFTTPGTVAGNAYLYIFNNASGSRNVYIDAAGVSLSTANHPLYGEGRIKLDGVVTTPLNLRNAEDSTNALNVQTSTGSQLFNADTLDGSVNVGDVTSATARFAVRSTNKVAVNVLQSGAFDLLTLTDNSGTSKDVFRVQDEGAVLLQNSTDSAAALQVRNLAGSNIFTVDTSSGKVILGKASTTTGSLIYSNSSNANTVTIQSGTTSSSYTLTLPTALNGSGACLVDTNGSGALGFASCSNGVNTVGTFNNATSYANGASISGNTLTLGAADGSNPGLLTAGTQTIGGAKTLTGSTLLKNASDGYFGVEIQTSSGASLFRADTQGRKVGIGEYSQVAADNLNATLVVGATAANRVGIRVVGTASYTGNFIDALDSNGNNIFRLQSNGNIITATGVFSSNGQTAASTNSSTAVLTSGNVSGATSTSGAVGVQSGDSTTSGNTGSITVKSGNATSGNSGSVTIDSGTATGTKGTIFVGSVNTGSVQIGNASSTFSVTSTTLAISGGAITGATGLTMASGNFTQNGSGTFSTGTGNVSLNGNVSVATGKTLTVVAGATSLTGAAAGGGVATQINTGAANNIGIVVKGAASQSVDLMQLQNSGGTALVSVSNAGLLTATNGVAVSGGNFTQSGSGTFATGTGNVGLNGKTTVSTNLAADYGMQINNASTTGKGLYISVGGSSSVNNTALTINNSTQSIFSVSGTGEVAAAGLLTANAGLKVQSGGVQIFDDNGVLQLYVGSNDNIVGIGPDGGNTIGTILGLGIKTTSGDPTGEVGAMYYNSATNDFRCYTDHWQSCIQNPRTMYKYTNEMFAMADRTACAVASCGYVAATDMSGYYGNSGDYTTADFAGTTGHPGIGSFWTNGNAAGYAGMTNARTANQTILLGNGDYWKYENLVMLKTALSITNNQYNFISGFTNSMTSTDGTNGCFIKYTNTTALNTPTFVGKCVSNNVASTCTATMPNVALDTWYRTSVEVNSAGNQATFKVNGSSCTVSSNIPTVAGREVSPQSAIYKMSGTSAPFFNVDYVTIEGQFGTSR